MLWWGVFADMAEPIIALIDCNNFFCSCERVFQPHLNNKPVIVLSNNDGCVVARSEQVKAMGIPMGIPIFKIQHLIDRHDIQLFSSNFALYADMSHRIQNIVADQSSQYQIYSVDEIFMDIEDTLAPEQFAKDLRARVLQHTGIPTCVGIGPTKTLAKLANRQAKKNPRYAGVCDLRPSHLRERVLAKTAVEDIWGIGPALAAHCHQRGIRTAQDLIQTDRRAAARFGGVMIERLILELSGTICFDMETVPADPKSCAVTRSFGTSVTAQKDMLESVATHATRAAQKCRKSGVVASAMTVFMQTNRHRDEPQYNYSQTAQLVPACDDTSLFLKTARTLVETGWRDGFSYKRAGVILTGLRSSTQGSLDFVKFDKPKSKQMMDTLDAINAKYGTNSLFYGAQGTGPPCIPKQNRQSGHYTTLLSDVPIVKAN